MTAIDDRTLMFRDGSTVYVTDTGGGCSGLGNGGYALVTENYGTGLCRGTIAKVTDLRSGMIAGSCVMGSFTPYRKP